MNTVERFNKELNDSTDALLATAQDMMSELDRVSTGARQIEDSLNKAQMYINFEYKIGTKKMDIEAMLKIEKYLNISPDLAIVDTWYLSWEECDRKKWRLYLRVVRSKVIDQIDGKDDYIYVSDFKRPLVECPMVFKFGMEKHLNGFMKAFHSHIGEYLERLKQDEL